MKFIKLQGRYWHFIILVWIFFIYTNGIINFSFSFLLSKVTLSNISQCHNHKLHPKLFDSFKGVGEHCSLPPFFSKAIIILIDGFRFDFAYSTDNKSTPYLGNMPIFGEILAQKPQNSFMAPFIADPPTTTQQRLQGLTTGTLPTFIDISSNFGGDAIMEDSIVKQMSIHNKKTIFMGDDTWKNLFPNLFHKSFFYPSLNVKDLNTVDDGIIRHLVPQIKEENEWDIIIAHFLGVDHCGHRYGPLHPEMSRKLKQMDEVIRKVIQNLPKDTVLYVIGDHGMTQTGDHGGDSLLEVNSTFFMYSKKTVHKETNNLNMNGVPQVNIVPTISLQMGLPIPFSNLGSVIPEIFNIYPSNDLLDSSKKKLLDDLYNLQALNQNANQIRRYLQTYNSIMPSFESNEFDILEKLWINSNKQLNNLLHTINANAEKNYTRAIKEIKKLHQVYLNGMLKSFSEKWAKFDLPGMITGLSITILGTIIVVMILIETSQRSLHLYTVGNIIMVSIILSVPLTAIYCLVLEESKMDKILKYGTNFGSFTSLSFAFMYLFWSVFKTHVETNETSSSGKLIVIFNLFCPILHACGLFSNSFVINEDIASSFLLQSLLVANTARIFAQSIASKKLNPKNPFASIDFKNFSFWMSSFLLSLTMIRFGDAFRKCREEKGPLCESSNFLLSIATIPENWTQYRGFRLLEALSVLAIIVIAFIILWRDYKRLYKNDLTSLLVQYIIPFSILCISASWILDYASKETVKKFLPKKQELPAQTAILALLIIPIINFSFPISVSYDMALLKHKLYRFHWTMLLNQGPILLTLTLLAFLLSGDGLSLSIFICLASLIIWCYTWSSNSNQTSINTEEDHGSIFATAVTLSAYASHLFFSTGHQAAFPAIHWNAAFVFSTGDNVGRIIPAIAIIFETFYCQLIIVGVLFIMIPLREAFTKSERVSISPESIVNTTVRGILPNSNINATLSVGHLSRYENSLLCLQLSFIFMQSLKLLIAMASSFVLRRHLMVWKIFAPRLITEEISFLVTAFAIMLFQLLNIKLIRKLDNL